MSPTPGPASQNVPVWSLRMWSAFLFFYCVYNMRENNLYYTSFKTMNHQYEVIFDSVFVLSVQYQPILFYAKTKTITMKTRV